MNFSYNWLQSFFNEKLPEPEELAKLITLRLFEVDEIQKKQNDWLINIDVLPNRACDCFSHFGIAREISAITKKKLIVKEKKLSIKKGSVSLKIKDKENCSRYTLALIRNVKIEPSPQWMQERLKVCGLQPINNIVDIVNYVMLETGQPMHAFDFNEIAGQEIIVRKAREKEKIIGLDNKEYFLNNEILVVSDPEKLLGIAGIKGGKNAEIKKETTVVALESACFNRIAIRKASRTLKLRTDASLRFEHGLTPDLTIKGMKRALELIQANNIELIDYYPIKDKKKIIKIDLDYSERLLGKAISKNETKKTLSLLDFKTIKEGPDFLEVEVPTQRLDVNYQEDLIEEIGRIHGYENIESVPPQALTIPPVKNQELFWINQAKKVLESLNFTETYNYSFISQEQTSVFGYNSSDLFEVEKPVSLDQKYLRPSLIPGILKNIKENQKNFKNFKMFELGRVFQKNKEFNELVGITTGDCFYQVKGAVELLIEKMGISKVIFIESKQDLKYIDRDKKADIFLDKQRIGLIGNFSHEILKNLKIKPDVSFFVLDFDQTKEKASEQKIFQPLPRFPEITRDMAVLVPLETAFQELLDSLRKTKLSLVEDIILFDVYQGKEIPKDRKSFALRFIYRDNQKTLTDQQVNLSHQKITDQIEKNKNWKIRK
jgi:phenylalanyl-tRNA synthetase beta chain